MAATGRNVEKEVGVVSAMFSVEPKRGRDGLGFRRVSAIDTGRNVLVKLTGKQYRKAVLHVEGFWGTRVLGVTK